MQQLLWYEFNIIVLQCSAFRETPTLIKDTDKLGDRQLRKSGLCGTGSQLVLVLMFLCKNSSQRFLISWGRGELLIKRYSAAAKNTRFGQQEYLNYYI